jgi:CRP-like cAMP-binding protein
MSAIASLRLDALPLRDSAPQPTLTALRSCPWFAGWSAADLASLALSCSLRSFGPGQVVAAEGKPLGAVAVVVKGRVRVVRRAEGGREVTLEVFRAGDLAADAVFQDEGILRNDWLAAETCLLMFIPRADFIAHLRHLPEAALALARDYERRLSRAKTLATGLALADVQARLFEVLGRLAREEGEALSDGILIKKCPTQQELGNMIGACRETVSRMIAELARQELVQLQGRKLKISPRFLAQATVAGAA